MGQYIVWVHDRRVVINSMTGTAGNRNPCLDLAVPVILLKKKRSLGHGREFRGFWETKEPEELPKPELTRNLPRKNLFPKSSRVQRPASRPLSGRAQFLLQADIASVNKIFF